MTGRFRFYCGDSMRTAFRQGDCIVFEEVPVNGLRAGDVVLFRSFPDRGMDTVHRVVATGDGSVTVRGDDNPPGSEEVVPFERILGRVTALERRGRRYPVAGGLRGRIRSGLLSGGSIPRRIAGSLWSLLRKSGITRLFWRPRLETLTLDTDGGSVKRLVSSGRTVGKWYPDLGILILRKPWDLAVRRRDLENQR